MAGFTAYTAILALGMLITGSMNTISTNYANNAKAAGTMAPSTIWGKLNNENETVHAFDHPFFQALCMFLGECLCVLAHMVIKKERTPTRQEIEAAQGRPSTRASGTRCIDNGSFWFAIPACCDMLGTGIMYSGLCLSYASVFQMLRGSSIIFTALMSRFWLGNKIRMYQWFAVLLVALGAVVVGLAGGKPTGGKDETGVMIGNGLIVLAQFIVAIQMTVEEKITKIYQTPALKCVGLEGIFGFCILSVVLVPMFYIRPGGYPIENVPDAWTQLTGNWVIAVAMTGNILSIAFFNFFGLSITKALSASHRMVIDSARTLVVWGYSLLVGWEDFHALQLLGFFFLSVGMAMYNEVFRVPAIFEYPDANEPHTGSFVGLGDSVCHLKELEATPPNSGLLHVEARTVHGNN